MSTLSKPHESAQQFKLFEFKGRSVAEGFVFLTFVLNVEGFTPRGRLIEGIMFWTRTPQGVEEHDVVITEDRRVRALLLSSPEVRDDEVRMLTSIDKIANGDDLGSFVVPFGVLVDALFEPLQCTKTAVDVTNKIVPRFVRHDCFECGGCSLREEYTHLKDS